MKAHIVAAMLAAAATATAAKTASAASTRFIDPFSSTTLDPRWVLDESPDPDLYGAGGGFVLDGVVARFNNVSNYHYAHLETAATYDSTLGLRADAIMRQDVGPTSTWGMSVAVYYDAEDRKSVV